MSWSSAIRHIRIKDNECGHLLKIVIELAFYMVTIK